MTLRPAASPRQARTAEWALALASTLAVVVAVAAAEVALRAAEPSFLLHSRARHPHVYDEAYGWSLRRGARYVGRGGERITVNEQGYRGAVHAPFPAPGTTRVVMLGDSITFGTGVGDDQTFSHLLDASPRLEVVNLGVDGYGTDQELIRLEREALGLHPHVVILNFCVRNDYFDNALPVALYDGVSAKPYFTLSGRQLRRHDAHLRLSPRQRAAVTLMERSHVVNALLHLGGSSPEAVAEARDDADWGGRREAILANFDRTAELTRHLIAAMADRSALAGAEFVVLIHPDRRAWSGDESMVTPLTTGGLGRTRLVSMGGHYRARKLSFEELTLDRLGHLSPRGHAVASEVIHSVIDSLPGGDSRS